jgi:hypothetical protein
MVPERPNLPSALIRIGLIDRYLARTIAVPLIGTLILAAMLLILDKMLRLFQYVVDARWRSSTCSSSAISSPTPTIATRGCSST